MQNLTRKNETGRSMVEMLGVLSIIGVLSVGGISAYSTAMEKHKANEALHKASMMATTVSAYAMTNDGKLPSTITDFANSGYATTLSDNGTQFKLTVAGIGEDVCTQMKNAKGGMVRNVDCDEATGDATITYYKNLATDPTEGEKSPTGEKPDPACADVKCDDGLTCVKGSCLCPDGTLPCNGECCASNEFCTASGSTSGECKELTCDKTDEDCCVTNADCGKNEFCLFGGHTSATNASTTCAVPANGVCTALTGDYAPKVVENTEEPLYGVTYSDAKMNWWSASNWCQANGSCLMSLANLNTLSGLSASAMNETDSKTAHATALQGGLGNTGGYVWLEDASSSTTCHARFVRPSDGAVGGGGRNFNSAFALCR